LATVVSEYDVTPWLTAAIWVQFDPPFLERWILKPVSFDELSVQARLTGLPETAVAVTFDEAARMAATVTLAAPFIDPVVARTVAGPVPDPGAV
jgi:hypothetical protein